MKNKNKTLGKGGTLGKGTLRKEPKDGEKEFDPKIEELKQILKTEDGGKLPVSFCNIIFLTRKRAALT